MDADALIWDLRDGWGGAVPEYLDLFNVRAPTMQVFGRDRTGEFENVKPIFNTCPVHKSAKPLI